MCRAGRIVFAPSQAAGNSIAVYFKTKKSTARIRPLASPTILLVLTGAFSGCTLIETASPKATQSAQPTALSWLTNWVSQPAEMVPGFDVESIKPASRTATILPENLLEITIWDLYEPGKPYTFPVRVSTKQTIEIPMLGDVPVDGRTIAEVEKSLTEDFRGRELLLNPRVLVRSLDSPLVKVQVNGAVSRPGYVELTRTDLSVYAAIVSAGGLKKNAGTQVAVTRRNSGVSAAVAPTPPKATVARSHPEPAAYSAADPIQPLEPHAPVQRANSTEEISVVPPQIVPQPAPNRGLYSVGDAETTAASPTRDHRAIPAEPDEATTWYDVTLEHDRDELQALQLAEGDTVTVKAAAPPLRIIGIVNRPGAYPLPPGRKLDVWQAIDLAGGIRDENAPLNITLLHAAGEPRGARRWLLSVETYEKHPVAAPFVEPGDLLTIEPTTGSKIKRAVGDLWSKP